LPNLVVIGAAKCGTTSLHEYLDLHPAVSMSQEKELNFFVADKNWSRGLDWYQQQFPDAPVRGESSPAYTAYPLLPGVPERMAATIPNARLVYLVRDPIDRIVSHYVHRTVNWPNMGSLEDALDDAHVREWLVTPSYYWQQLEQYLRHFPRDRILLLDSDELRASRDEVLYRVFAFLGVDASFRTPEFERAHNAATGRTRRTSTGEVVSSILTRTLGAQGSRAVRERAPAALKSRFRAETEPPTMRQAQREELAAELAPEVERLRAETGLAFAGWTL
jgi:hypothetical protein